MRILVAALLTLSLGHATFLGDNLLVQRHPRSLPESITGDNRTRFFTDTQTVDIYLNVPQLLVKNGYPGETYVVKTEDGYLVTVHRIPHGKKKPAQPSKNVVLLFRSLYSNTIGFLFLGPERAIGYKLADMGYDVWMVEMRGNSYSKAHVKLPPTSTEFWDISWDEMGTYDLPAAMNLVLNKTGVNKVFLMGYSLGTTTLFAGLSVNPWINDKVRLLVALAPVAFTDQLRGPLGTLGEVVPEAAWNLIPYQSLLPEGVKAVIKFLGQTLCGTTPSAVLCTLAVTLVDGNEFGMLNSTALPALTSQYLDSDSSKTLAHFVQGVRSGKFQKYDYGPIGNMKTYGTATPPEYDLSKITAPVALFASEGDIFGDPEDCRTLASKLPNVALFRFTEQKSFTHIDFLLGNNAPEQVYQHVYNIMEKY